MPTYHFNLALLFDEVVAINAGRPALRYRDREYSYSEISQWTDALASEMISRGCQRGDVIAIGHSKQPLSYALMLASIRLGIAYVNIDVESPIARITRILQDSDVKLLFCDDSSHKEFMLELAHSKGCDLIMLEEKVLPLVTNEERVLQTKLSQSLDGSSIAYIMYTSGSTGMPKGVAVTHQNILHFIAWGQQRFRITNQDNFANLSPMYFDNSVFDFYVGLFSGACLTPVSREILAKPYELVAYVSDMRCSIWFSVPSLLIYLMTMKAMSPSQLIPLRTIIFGGEGYPKIELKKLYDLFSKQAELVNVYGPTECTCICSAYTLQSGDFNNLDGLPALGQLNSNFDYRIIDDQGQDAEVGELCLIGPNVAAGYFNDLERSTESFFILTEPRRFMKRMYRTGDLVRDIQGILHFLGRKDNQIKHMGYRIELEEIEQALVNIPQINQAAVIYLRGNSAYGKIIGFAASLEDIDEKYLVAELGKILPAFMIPSRIFIRSELPKNPNGKVDRQQLETLIHS